MYLTANNRRDRGGFTLVEALVIAGVLAVLAALLFPVVKRQMELGKATACVARLRSLGNAVRLWRVENNDMLAPSTTTLSWRPSRHLFEAGVITSAAEMCCPAVNTVQKGAWYDVTSKGGTYHTAFLNQPVSYGVNTIAFNRTTPKGWGVEVLSSYKVFLGKESHVPIFFDARAWQVNSTAWSDPAQRLERMHFPHGEHCNVLFLDGHVESLDRQGVLALNPLGDVGVTY